MSFSELLKWKSSGLLTVTGGTPQRAFGTTYTAIASTDQRLWVTVGMSITSGSTTTFTHTIGGASITEPGPGLTISVTGLTGATVSETLAVRLVFAVDPGGSYSVNNTGTAAAATLTSWVEFYG